jgi:hypothetical protein
MGRRRREPPFGLALVEGGRWRVREKAERMSSLERERGERKVLVLVLVLILILVLVLVVDFEGGEQRRREAEEWEWARRPEEGRDEVGERKDGRESESACDGDAMAIAVAMVALSLSLSLSVYKLRKKKERKSGILQIEFKETNKYFTWLALHSNLSLPETLSHSIQLNSNQLLFFTNSLLHICI